MLETREKTMVIARQQSEHVCLAEGMEQHLNYVAIKEVIDYEAMNQNRVYFKA
jgi:hypothetical protein